MDVHVHREISALVEKRERARGERRYQEADAIRDDLRTRGVEVLDREDMWKCGPMVGLYDPKRLSLKDGAIKICLDLREEARAAKDYANADFIRDLLKEAGVELKDREGIWWSTNDSRHGGLPVEGEKDGPGTTFSSGARPNAANGEGSGRFRDDQWNRDQGRGRSRSPPPREHHRGGDDRGGWRDDNRRGDHHRGEWRDDHRGANEWRDDRRGGDHRDRDRDYRGDHHRNDRGNGWSQPPPGPPPPSSRGGPPVPSSAHGPPVPTSAHDYHRPTAHSSSQSRTNSGSGDPMVKLHDFLFKREELRAGRDFEGADKIRDVLGFLGIVLNDKDRRWSLPDGRSGDLPYVDRRDL